MTDDGRAHAERGGEEGEEGAGQLTAVQSHTALDPAEDAGGEEDGAGGELGSAGLVLGVHWEIWDAIEWDKRGSKRGREPSVNEVGSRRREPAMPLRATANTSAGRLPGALARPPRRPVKLFDRLGGLRPAHPQLPNRPPTSPRVLSPPPPATTTAMPVPSVLVPQDLPMTLRKKLSVRTLSVKIRSKL